MKTFRPYQPDQMLLLPPSIEEWLPEGHLARFVREVVATLDLRAIEDTYTEERGNPPYHPRLMVTLLLYAYSTGTYSSRRMAAKLWDDVAYRYLAAENVPDFRTLSDFRKTHGPALNGLFVQVLKLCAEAGLVTLGRVAVDGTKVKANASKHKAMSYARMSEREVALKQQVAELLARAQAVDDAEDATYGEDRRGDELPEELQRAEGRLAKILAAKAALEAQARAQAVQDAEVAKANQAERERQERENGRRFGGHPFQVPDPEQAMPAPRGRIPAKLSVAERMQRKLRTKAGHAVYARRKVIVEPVNGQIKQARGFRQFLRRGVERVGQEWSLVCTAHNLLKLRAAWAPA